MFRVPRFGKILECENPVQIKMAHLSVLLKMYVETTVKIQINSKVMEIWKSAGNVRIWKMGILHVHNEHLLILHRMD